MNYEKFLEELINELTRRGCETNLCNKRKNNVVVQTLQVRFPGTDGKSIPIFYPEYIFKDLDEMETIVSIVDKLFEIVKKETNISNDFISAFREMPLETKRKGIYLSVIGYSENKELLDTIPHKRFLDLAYVYRFHLDEVGEASFLITHNNKDMFEFANDEELFTVAKTNTKRDLPAILECNRPEVKLLEDLGVFNVTNKYYLRGFVCALFTETLDYYTEKFKENFYMIPSSIHEALFMPESMTISAEVLYKMCKDVNETAVSDEDRLVNNVYYYDIKAKKIIPFKDDNAI